MPESPSPPHAIGSDAPTSQFSAWLARSNATLFSAYCIAAAFGTYFCMYAFRKPFTAGTYEGIEVGEIKYKAILIAAQTAGYTLSKFIGIKIVSEMSPNRRAASIIGLIAAAQGSLILFAIVPPPWNWLCLFLNGLPLGMVFGLVLSFLEGRRLTEALSAGLCASFIVSSGVVKSIGNGLLTEYGVSEFSMPMTVGWIFLVPLILFVWMLKQIPPPATDDEQLRSKRVPMNRAARWELFRRHRWELIGLVAIYLLLSIGRGIRDDFAVEIWQDLGYEGKPSIFAQSETLIMFGVILINGLAITIRSNRNAFLGSLLLTLLGFATVLVSLALFALKLLAPFPFMVLVGLGTYVPYVAFHTTVFERFIAAFRERGNIGYLMYLSDASGYLAYVLVVILLNLSFVKLQYLSLFNWTATLMAVVSVLITIALYARFLRKLPPNQSLAEENPS